MIIIIIYLLFNFNKNKRRESVKFAQLSSGFTRDVHGIGISLDRDNRKDKLRLNHTLSDDYLQFTIYSMWPCNKIPTLIFNTV